MVEPAPSPEPAREVPAFTPPFVLPTQAGAALPLPSATGYPDTTPPETAPAPARRSRKGLVIALASVAAVVVVGAVVLIPLLAQSSAPIDADDDRGPSIAPWEHRTHEPEDDASPKEEPEEETVYWDEVEVGDCWRYDEADWSSGYADIVACDVAHSDEIYYEFSVEGDEYPGDKIIMKEANTVCMTEFTKFTGMAYNDSELDFWAITPTEITWNTLDDRLVQCSIYDPESTGITGTLQGANR